MKLQIIVEISAIHPYLDNGEKITQYHYDMGDSLRAEAKYNELSKDDCCSHYTRIYIVHLG